MSTQIKQLTLKGSNEGIYVRTSTGAVNCDPTLWTKNNIQFTQQSYKDPITGESKTRVTLSEVLTNVPTLIDNKLQGLALSIASSGNNTSLQLKNSGTLISSVSLPASGSSALVQSSSVGEGDYSNLQSSATLQNDSEALSSKATMKIIGQTVGWVVNEIDRL